MKRTATLGAAVLIVGFISNSLLAAPIHQAASSNQLATVKKLIAGNTKLLELKDRNGEVQSVYNLSQETWPQSSPYKARERRTGCAERVVFRGDGGWVCPMVCLACGMKGLALRMPCLAGQTFVPAGQT